MQGAVISITQQKGGAGKTTLAIQLATTWAEMGKSVALVDLDPQASLSTWFEARRRWQRQRELDVTVERCEVNLVSVLENLKRRHDLVLLDSPSKADADTRIAVRLADLVLIPCQPQALDLWATKSILELARTARRQAFLVFNRVPARSRLADRLKRQTQSERWPVANQCLGNRQAFATSIEMGHGVVEIEKSCRASLEILSLAKEIGKFLKKNVTKRSSDAPPLERKLRKMPAA